MRLACLVLALALLAAGCSPDGGPDTTDADAGREIAVEQLSSGDRLPGGQTQEEPLLVVAPSAADLSAAVGTRIPDSGEGTYLAAFWGEKPTGGYSVAIESVRLEGERVTVLLGLGEPAPDAMVTEALTYPYSIVLARDLDPEGLEFSVRETGGGELGWPVRQTES